MQAQLIITAETQTELLPESVFLWIRSTIRAQMMKALGSPFVPCGSKWNHTTSQWENSHNSAISRPILDLFCLNAHPRVSFCSIWFSMESSNLSVEK